MIDYLPSLSSAFGRGGGGHFRFFESFGKFCLMTEGGQHLNMRAPRKNFTLCMKGGRRFKIYLLEMKYSSDTFARQIWYVDYYSVV